jgi:hypothetical protein
VGEEGNGVSKASNNGGGRSSILACGNANGVDISGRAGTAGTEPYVPVICSVAENHMVPVACPKASTADVLDGDACGVATSWSEVCRFTCTFMDGLGLISAAGVAAGCGSDQTGVLGYAIMSIFAIWALMNWSDSMHLLLTACTNASRFVA